MQEKIEVTVIQNADSKTYSFSRMPSCVEDLKSLNIADEYLGGCAIICALAQYELDKDKAIEMLEFVNGPENVSAFDKNFINEQMKQYPYVMRSYFDGTSPENNYTIPATISLTIKENVYSRDEAGYVKLFFHSSGADSDRGLTLRYKPSTNQWFLFSDTYKGFMAGIRQPQQEDKWN